MPSVGIATTVFMDAAEKQGDSLGFNPAMAFVEHPIQDRTDEELCSLAEKSVEEVVSYLSTTA